MDEVMDDEELIVSLAAVTFRGARTSLADNG